MKNNKHSFICAALSGQDTAEIIERANALEQIVDLFEIRLDLTKRLNIVNCISTINKPLLFTNRPEWEGGNFRGSEEDRLSKLYESIHEGAAYIDIELKTSNILRDELIKQARNSKTKVVVSNHNFQLTPSTGELEDILNQMMESGADIGKIITTANTPADSARILSLLDIAAENNFTLTAFAMGEYGRISRFATLFLGGCMSYAAYDLSQATAPGQFTARQLAELIQLYESYDTY